MATRARKTAEAVSAGIGMARAKSAPAAALRLNGSLDRADADGSLEGWCWSPDAPDQARDLAVLVDGAEVLRIRADQPRDDLAAASIGNGAHAFRCALPAACMSPGRSVALELRDLATGQPVGVPVTIEWPAGTEVAPPASAQETLAGSLDRVSADGWLSGWCWFPDRPEAHAELIVLVDDEPIGTVIADGFRPDLQQAGIGDGTHGFAFALPYSALADRGLLTVAVQERRTGRLLGEKMTMRLGRLSAAEDRIASLERELRLLRGEIEQMRTGDAARAETHAARDLFATVAGFFHELAEGGSPRGGRAARLAGTIADLSARAAPLVLAVPETPRASVCVAATAPFETVHACLAALSAAGIDGAADVEVLDDGAADPANALLPALVRNLRYRRIPEGMRLTDGRAALAAEARGDIIAFLAPEACPAPGWLDEILDTFGREPAAALVGGRVVRPDGLLHHAFLRATRSGGIEDAAALAPADAPAFGYLRPVDAVGGYAFAVRRRALLDAGGFSPLFARFGHATVELCARLRRAGHAVLYQPLATAVWQDATGAEGGSDGAAPDIALGDEETLRLRERLHGGWPSPVAWHARVLVIDDDLPRPEHDAGSIATFEQMQILRRLGYHVTFAPVHGGAADTAARQALARHGIALAAPPHFPSVTAYLKDEGARLDLIQVYRYANAALLRERVRELAPHARFVLATADLHHLRERRRAEVTGRRVPEAERAAELRCIRAADATIVTSDYEHALLRGEVDPARLVLLRWIARAVPPASGFADRRDICFLGNFRHPPNIDGVQWFVAEVLPLVRRHLPALKLLIAGSDMPDAIAALACDAVTVLGWVPSLPDLFGRTRLSVAPLRFGAGFKGKVATSLAHGLPVVGSSVSLEGTGLEPGDGVAVADTAEEFADAVVRLHEDAALWQAQSARALERVATLYAPEAAEAVWREMLARLNLPVPGEAAG